MSRYLIPIIAAIIGGAMAGGWLVVDLLLPEPIGDYLLFLLMGVANAGIGWQVGRLISKQKSASTSALTNSTETGLETKH